jgi:hypothetical protein
LGFQAGCWLGREGTGGGLAGGEGTRNPVTRIGRVLEVERNMWALAWPVLDMGWALQPLQQPHRPAQGQHGKQQYPCTWHNSPTRRSSEANPVMPRLLSIRTTRICWWLAFSEPAWPSSGRHSQPGSTGGGPASRWGTLGAIYQHSDRIKAQTRILPDSSRPREHEYPVAPLKLDRDEPHSTCLVLWGPPGPSLLPFQVLPPL